MRISMFIMLIISVCLAAFSSLSCAEDDDDESRGGIWVPADDDDENDDDAANDDASDDDEDDPYDPRCQYPTDDAPLNVIECDGRNDVLDHYQCWGIFDAWDCIDDYLQLLDTALFVDNANPMSYEEALEKINAARRGEVEVYDADDRPGAEELKSIIEEQLNASFMFEQINSRNLYVDELSREELNGYVKRKILLTDALAGAFDLVLLTPPESEQNIFPVPVIVATHGHGENSEDYLVNSFCFDLVGEGFAFLVYTRRGSGGGNPEGTFSKAYYLDGFSAMGMRWYEARVVKKYIDFLGSKDSPIIDSSRIGGIGHSGGSALNNLYLRVDNIFDAVVTDMTDSYMGNDPEAPYDDFYMLDTTHPGIFPYHLIIRDFTTADIPLLGVPYGYYSHGPENGSEDTILYLPGREPEILKEAEETGPVDDLIIQFFIEQLMGE